MELNKKTIFLLMAGIAILILAIFLTSNTSETKIQIGWLTSVATEAQQVLVLKNTDILEKNGLEADFFGFSYAPPLTEAALAGNLHVAFLADIPALKLIEKDPDWVIVARHVDFRAGIIVPAKSPIMALQELKAKKIISPVGSATHIYAIKKLEESGLNLDTDVQLINLDIFEQAPLIERGTDMDWIQADAIISWDPTIALAEKSGKGRILQEVNPKQVMLMRKSFIQKDSEKAKIFMKAFKEAYLFYAKNQKLADDWYIKESRITFPPEILEISSSYEPNLKANTLQEINIVLSDQDIQKIQEIADYATQKGMLTKKHDVRSEIDFGIMNTS